MADGRFKYEGDPLKHFVRVKGWLPLCRERSRRLKAKTKTKKQARRLRYFTFCAVDAVDVLMLDLAKVLRRSGKDKFDTVYFFDQSPEAVADTQLRIPGAIGFAGDFTKTVLTPASGASLAAPADEEDTIENRNRQRLQATKQAFVESFPFDVVNLDIEDLMFKDLDDIPGDVINALRHVCEWQQRAVPRPGQAEYLDGFTLLFTTRVEKESLTNDCATMLTDQLAANIVADATLGDLLQSRAGVTVGQLKDDNFTAFLELGIPKVIANVLMEKDWHPEPDPGVLVFRFTRPAAYDILHFAMNVLRHDPPLGKRPPNTIPPSARDAYRAVAKKVFEQEATFVTPELVAATELTPSLEQIRALRRKHYPDEDPAA